MQAEDDYAQRVCDVTRQSFAWALYVFKSSKHLPKPLPIESFQVEVLHRNA
jgi:hypothetical protein